MTVRTPLAPNPSHCAAHARDLEGDAADYPDERGEILLEAAHQWHLAGDDDRALELLAEVVAGGGEDGEFATVATADVLFASGREEEARAALDRLRRRGPEFSPPCHIAAETLEARGDLRGAQRWFNLAIARLTEREIAALDGPDGWRAAAAIVVRGRARVRAALGLPLDEFDTRVPPIPEQPFAPAPPLRTPLFARGDVLARPELATSAVRMLVWQRASRAEAAARFGPPFGGSSEDSPTEDAHLRDLELDLRAMSTRGTPRIDLVLGTADSLAAFAAASGGSPHDAATRGAYLDRRHHEGAFVAWPPPRNGPCWCGAQAKYKKCCGRAEIPT